MSAMIGVKAETRQERQDRERKAWIEGAVSYLIEKGIYAQDEVEGAVDLAENLHYHYSGEDGEINWTPKDAVDEELTYWN